MKVVTLNLWNGGRLFDAVRNFLVAQQADVYFLQEVYNGDNPTFEDRFQTVKKLKLFFPEYHFYYVPVYSDTRAKEGKIDDGQLIISRWPFLQQERIFLDVLYGEFDQDGTTDFSVLPSLVQKAVVSYHGKEVSLINVHGPVNLDGLADTDRRLKMKEVILKMVTPYSIVAGDFNVRPQTQTIRLLEAQLTNVFLGELKTSFNLTRKDLVKFPGYADAVVDMMLVTRNFQVVKKEHPQVDVSDHLPLVAVLEIKE